MDTQSKTKPKDQPRIPLSERRNLSVIETAEYLGTSRSSLLHDEKNVKGHPQSFRHPARKTTVFDRLELDEWVQQCKWLHRGIISVHKAIIRTRSKSNDTRERAFAALKKGLPKGHVMSMLPSTDGIHFSAVIWPNDGRAPALSVVMEAAETDAYKVWMMLTGDVTAPISAPL